MRIDLAPFLAVAALATIATLFVVRRRNSWSSLRLIALATLIGYLAVVVEVTVSPVTIDPELAGQISTQGLFWSGLNLVPSDLLDPRYLLTRQGIGNVALGLPVGFLVPLAFRTNLRRAVIGGFFFGFGIEAAQLGVSALVGFMYRVVDVTDLLLNWAGVLVGYGCFRIVASALARWVQVGPEASDAEGDPADRPRP